MTHGATPQINYTYWLFEAEQKSIQHIINLSSSNIDSIHPIQIYSEIIKTKD